MICRDVIIAASRYIDPFRRQNNFEIFGLDILIDENMKGHLI